MNSRNREKTVGRWVLMGIVFLGLATSIGALFFVARGDAIYRDELIKSVKYFVTSYVSLLAIMGGFLFAERRSRKVPGTAPIQALVFAITVTAVWCFSPALL